MRELLRLAAERGLTVHAGHLEDGILGMYSPDEARIYFDIRLTPSERRSVLAHELGHAHYGHRCDTPATERQADIYAAQLLIDHAHYAEAASINPDQHHIAEELGVTVDVIFTYETSCLTRVRGATYARPRLGAGQWAFRRAVAS